MAVKIRRALISTADRTGIREFACGLVDMGVEILSTGGTGTVLKEADIPIVEVANVTGFPEIVLALKRPLTTNVWSKKDPL